MANGEDKINPLFLQLVLSLQTAAWYQMGKVVSPISGKVEKNLAEARVSIDLLTMLQEKTRGNLLDEEKKILDNTVYTLQMNYIDELNSAQKTDKTESPSSEPEASESQSDTAAAEAQPSSSESGGPDAEGDK
jgi:phage-related minor tail protein